MRNAETRRARRQTENRELREDHKGAKLAKRKKNWFCSLGASSLREDCARINSRPLKRTLRKSHRSRSTVTCGTGRDDSEYLRGNIRSSHSARKRPPHPNPLPGGVPGGEGINARRCAK